MPSKKEYKKQLFNAFGKVSAEFIRSGDEDNYKKYLSIYEKHNGNSIEAKNEFVDEMIKMYGDDEESELYRSEMSEKFNNYQKINPKNMIDADATRNGMKLYANAKQAYDSLKWYQKIAAHFRSGDTYEPARKLRELNAYEEVIKECGGKLSEVNAVADAMIRKNSTYGDFVPFEYDAVYQEEDSKFVSTEFEGRINGESDAISTKRIDVDLDEKNEISELERIPDDDDELEESYQDDIENDLFC